LAQHKYLEHFENQLYALNMQTDKTFFYEIAGLVEWKKAIELDMVEDELLLSIPQELRKVEAHEIRQTTAKITTGDQYLQLIPTPLMKSI
jgi:hypothetical protein